MKKISDSVSDAAIQTAKTAEGFGKSPELDSEESSFPPDFNEYFTGPLNGFQNAVDYYTKCSSKQFLKNCHVPTLVINAQDDPFLPDACYPVEEAAQSPYIYLRIPKYGGHLGFVNFNVDHYWYEWQILDFLNKLR